MSRSQDGRQMTLGEALVFWLLISLVLLSFVFLLLVVTGYSADIMQSLGVTAGDEEKMMVGDEFSLLESNADHGDNLRDVMWGIRNEETEFMAIFDGKKKVLEYTSGEESSVSMDARVEFALDENSVLLHNHPLIEAAFSLTDLKTFAEWNAGEAIVVTAATTYRLTAPNGWPTGEEIDDFLDKNWKCNYDVMAQEGLVGFTDGTNDDGELERFHYSKSALIERLAEEFGLVYTVEKAEKVNGCINNPGPF